jgi:hypothetical protein
MIRVAEVEEIMLKYGIIVIAMLVALALFTVPTLAARPLQMVTYGGTGVPVDIPGTEHDVVGDNVRFAGLAQNIDGVTFNGHGTFAGTFDGEEIKANLNVGRATFDDATYVCIHGSADVTYLGIKYSNVGYEMGLMQDGTYQEYYLSIYGDPSYPWGPYSIQWLVAGDDVITGSPIIFH